MNTTILKILLFCLLMNVHFIKGQNIVINEILASNTNSIKDEDGTYQDWIEIYNNGTTAVNLLGYGLSDDPTLPMKWIFPSVPFQPGQYLIVWASDKNRSVSGSPLHTNFKINSTGDNIVISDSSGNIINSSAPVNLQENISYGRSPNGIGAFAFFPVPTPNTTNSSSSYNEILKPPVFSKDSAFLTSDFTLTISSQDLGTTIIYTLDGSEPDENNLMGTQYDYKISYPELPGQSFGSFLKNSFKTLLYSNSINITDLTSQPNKLCNISTTWDNSPKYFPNGQIFKATIVKAKVIKPGALPSKTVTKNYFISLQGINKFTLPVVSISFNENDFYDYYNGISVAGVDFDNWRTNNPMANVNENLGNFNRSGDLYEKVANLNYFVDDKEVINQKVGIRIHGDYSRIYPSKSMRIYARSSLGNDKLDFPIFSDEPYKSYERVIVKNSGSDFYNTMFRDPLCNELVKDLRMETEAHKQVITFINGEYWGILAIREQYDNNYFKQVYNIPSDEIDLLENQGSPKEGDNKDYIKFLDEINSKDLSVDSKYLEIKTRMDVDNFMDYFISNIYLRNNDWPGNNIIYWRKKISSYQPNAPYGHDGRWRWAFHDVTSTFGDPTFDSMARATTTNPAILPLWSTLILRKLLENNTFKKDFINRFADLMNTNFLPSRINKKIDEMAAVIAPEMNNQYFRWKAPVDNGDWQYHINKEKNFANQRPEYQRQHLRTKFNIDSNINVLLNVSDPSQGYIKINTIDIIDGTPGIIGNPYPWTGVYFLNIPIKLKAIAFPGYTFSHWSGASSSTNSEIEITPTGDFSIIAVFTPINNYEPLSTIYFWLMDDNIPNNIPLNNLNSTYEVGSDGVIQYQSCLEGYPFTSASPNWRKASMERRNYPTDINYRSQANNNLVYDLNTIKGLQIKEPFKAGNLENTVIFNFSTSGYKNIQLSFAAVNEMTGVTGIIVDYSINSGSPIWINTGLPSTPLNLLASYQIFTIDFKDIPDANNNQNFKIRIRFTGANLNIDNGNRVTFNNIAIDGIRMSMPFAISYTSPNTFVKNTLISNLIPNITGGTAANFSVSPDLPDGLALNSKTGIISGTPTKIVLNSNHTITAKNMEGEASFSISINVNDIKPSDLSYNTPNIFTKNQTITNLSPSYNGGMPTNFSSTPQLPIGLNLNQTTGVISGSPTQITPQTVYTITATNSGGSSNFIISITINDIKPSNLNYNTPNIFTKNQSITNLQPNYNGGIPTNFSVTPQLADGLSLDQITGVISGTPTQITSQTNYTITATNTGGSDNFNISITINDNKPGDLSYSTPNIFTKNQAITNLTPTINGSLPTNFTVNPQLPNGLTLNETTGVISGTPTQISPQTNYMITATNSGGNSYFNISITVNDIKPNDLSYSSPNIFTKNQSITNLSPNFNGGTPTNFSVNPQLPNGLDLNQNTGIISGTPTQIFPQTNFTITATNSGGSSDFSISITINDIKPSDLSYNTPNIFTKNQTIANLTPTINGSMPTNFSVNSQLPNGLDLNQNTGIISGTPTQISPQTNYTITAANSGGSIDFIISITINDTPPTDLSYYSPNIFNKGVLIEDLVPTVTGGAVVNYSIIPELPIGLNLNNNSGVISGTPTETTETKTYNITAQNSGGNTSFNILITVQNSLSIPKNDLNRLMIYPNPFSDKIRISDIDQAFHYKLFSIDGKLIKSELCSSNEIELGELANGVYLIEFSLDEFSVMKKIIKNR